MTREEVKDCRFDSEILCFFQFCRFCSFRRSAHASPVGAERHRSVGALRRELKACETIGIAHKESAYDRCFLHRKCTTQAYSGTQFCALELEREFNSVHDFFAPCAAWRRGSDVRRGAVAARRRRLLLRLPSPLHLTTACARRSL